MLALVRLRFGKRADAACHRASSLGFRHNGVFSSNLDMVIAKMPGIVCARYRRKSHTVCSTTRGVRSGAFSSWSQPARVGRSIVDTREPHQTTVLEVIKELGLEHEIIFNKGAVMVLPPGINRASGLQAALEVFGLSAS